MQIDYHQGNDNKYHNNCIYDTKNTTNDLLPHALATPRDRIASVLVFPENVLDDDLAFWILFPGV